MNKIRVELNLFNNRLVKSIESLESLETENVNIELKKDIELLILETFEMSNKIKEIIEQFNLYK